jgi:hypothetical protein
LAPTGTASAKRATPARDLRGHFLSKADEAARLQRLEAERHAGVVAKAATPAPPPSKISIMGNMAAEPAPEAEPEPPLEGLQRLFRACDHGSKRAFLRWLQELIEVDQTLLQREEW